MWTTGRRYAKRHEVIATNPIVILSSLLPGFGAIETKLERP